MRSSPNGIEAMAGMIGRNGPAVARGYGGRAYRTNREGAGWDEKRLACFRSLTPGGMEGETTDRRPKTGLSVAGYRGGEGGGDDRMCADWMRTRLGFC